MQRSMSAFFGRVDRALERLYDICGAIAAFFMVLLGAFVLASILTRMFGIYVAGLTAYSGYAMASASFLALAYTFRAGAHIRVALLRSRLSGRPLFWLELWCLSVGAFLTCFLAYYLVRMTWVSWLFKDRSEGADATPLWLPQTGVAIGSVVMAVCMVHALVRTVATGEIQSATGGDEQLLADGGGPRG